MTLGTAPAEVHPRALPGRTGSATTESGWSTGCASSPHRAGRWRHCATFYFTLASQ